MNQLTAEQIKTLEDAFASYPKDFSTTPKYASMKGIQEQLKSLMVDRDGKQFICYQTHGKKNEELGVYGFNMHKMIVGETNIQNGTALHPQSVDKTSENK
jgi:hypothetical protein